MPKLVEMKPKQKRIQFTKAELELINTMCAVASAQDLGEGDYCWTDAQVDAYTSLWNKVGELLRRHES